MSASLPPARRPGVFVGNGPPAVGVTLQAPRAAQGIRRGAILLGVRRLAVLLAWLVLAAPAAAQEGVSYSVPADNPFAGHRGAALVWAYGLRNPFRFCSTALRAP